MKYGKWVGVAAIAVAGVVVAAGYAPVEEKADAKTPANAPAAQKAAETQKAPVNADGTMAGWSKPPLLPPSMRPADYKP